MAIDLTLQSQIKNYTNFSSFPATGVANTIYIADDTNKMYRWDGSAYVEVSSSSGGVWGSISGTLSSQTDLQNALDGKVDKVTGKVLSSNDYTNTEKSKLAGIQAGAEVNVNADWNATSGDAQILNKPTIPTQTSNLTNNGADGVNPFITALDIPTFASADKMVTVGRNSTGSTLYKGTIVYISGSTGNRPNFVKAKADVELTSAGTFGVIESDIANNSDGNCVTIGTINNLDTRSSATNPFTSDTLADGDTIYLSPTTAGYITNVKPSAPNHLVYLGKVVRTSPTNGTIVYRVQNGYELEELHNVAISSVANNDVLQYESATSLWKNKSLPSSVTSVTGTAPISSSGGTTPAISISQATTSTNGYLSSTDWNTFNGKQSALVSGTNIKTINGSSVLGSGDLTVTGSGVQGIHTLNKIYSGWGTSMSLTATASSSTVQIANRLQVAPFKPANSITSTQLNINVGVALALSTFKIVIYSDNNGLPTNKLYESTAISSATTGIKVVSLTYTFNAGSTYWIGTICSGAISFATIPTAGLILLQHFNTALHSSLYYDIADINSVPSTWPVTSPANGQNVAFPLVVIQA